MSPTAMLTLMFAAFAMFAWSASRRFHLLLVGRPVESAVDHLGARLRGTWRFAFRQEKMDYYKRAGIAHKFVFAWFVMLSFRELVLWGRGFYAPFNLWVLGPAQPLGQAFAFAKDALSVLAIAGSIVFLHDRFVVRPGRMAVTFEGVAIIALIFALSVTDLMYDGASLALTLTGPLCNVPVRVATAEQCATIATVTAPWQGAGGDAWQGEWSLWPAPVSSLLAVSFHALPPTAQMSISRFSFWFHISLFFLFLNLLPYTKGLHVLAAIPNVFLRSLRPAGRLAPMAASAEQLTQSVSAARTSPDPISRPVGVARIEHFTWKSLLDLYTCTECGRCSDNCPAYRTGKILSPKHLTLALRDHLYSREDELITHSPDGHITAEPFGRAVDGHVAADPFERAADGHVVADSFGRVAGHIAADSNANGTPERAPINLVPEVIHPDVLWACTSCRACEEQCPVLISQVDKIVDMRRSLVMIRGEFPRELSKPFQGMETHGNPWNLSRADRPAWSEGLGVPTMKERPEAAVLFWVGCAASYDARAKRIARATAGLLRAANVDFAILGQEENCTGDPARRAGNEVLFAHLAEGNAETINRYRGGGGVRTVVTTCPHCFNTLKNEYPDFGLRVEVVHHSDFLLGLLAEGKLVPRNPVRGRVVYHDSCYLGRYNGVYDSPRELLKRIPGVELVEAEYWTKQRGLCCGAGGAQMWIEEQNDDKVNVKRTLQLVDALGPKANGAAQGHHTIASACPFCMTKLADGIKSKGLDDRVGQLDVAELLAKACEESDALVEALAGEEPSQDAATVDATSAR